MAGPGKRLSRVGSELAGRGRTACGQSLGIRKSRWSPALPWSPALTRRRLSAPGGGWSQGVVVLPTGAGKTAVAVSAMERVGRSTLVVVPTLALLKQWYSVLQDAFGGSVTIGLLGGGYHEITPITDHLRLGLHPRRALRGPLRARGLRRGAPLACPEERDHREDAPRALLPRSHSHAGEARRRAPAAPRACGACRLQALARGSRRDLPSPFELVRIPIELTAQERFDYAQAEAVYRDFLEKHRLPMRSPEDWQRFIMVASTSHSGEEALLAARQRREIREGAMRKGATLETLLRRHWDDRVIVFAKSVDEVYALSRRFLIPGVTYETPARERKEILDRFRDGRYRAVIASDVLNEGVDVPDAGVAIILAGSASRREYVQRLGRILRPREGKRAILYELVTAQTGEEFTARRRKEAVL